MSRKSSPGPAYEPSESKSVSCRKIDNGYIITESYSGKDGYKSCERYSCEKPKLEVSADANPPKSAHRPKTSSLGAAGAYLNKK